MTGTIPALPEDWEPTRATLHAHARVLGAIARTHALPHPRWWHISLGPTTRGLRTRLMPLPSGGSFAIGLDLIDHCARLETSEGLRVEHALDAGLPATELGDLLISELDALGLPGGYPRERFEDDAPRRYDTGHAGAFLATLTAVNLTFVERRNDMEGELGPIQLWPHGFDLAFEWFGAKRVTQEEGGEVSVAAAQLNLGFYPGGRPYFYSTPWPFDPALFDRKLPAPASWHTEGWSGAVLHLDDISGNPDARARVVEFAGAIFAVARPTLID